MFEKLSTWRPSASIENLKARAKIISTIREFFAARDVWEVETPLLNVGATTDVYIESFKTQYHALGSKTTHTFYLPTSPEFAMKRLIAAGSGCIFQISKTFRNGECGRWHQPEFTLLEWYRIDFDHHALMREVDALLTLILKTRPAKKYSYAELFKEFLKFDPHTASLKELVAYLAYQDITVDFGEQIPTQDTYLQLLLSHCIEPHLGFDEPVFIYDFPASQAALARIQPGSPPLAARFEVYVRGMELANGFYELTDAAEQEQRFLQDQQQRQRLGLATVPYDAALIAALTAGLPNCAGVALGMDRLVMLALQSEHIKEVISFEIPLTSL